MHVVCAYTDRRRSDDAEEGIVSICDYRGKWISSPFQFIRLNLTFPTATIPIHYACVHNLYVNSSSVDLIQVLRGALPKDVRTRFRSHSGSALEMEYALKTFGIDVSKELFRDYDPSLTREDQNNESIEEDIRRRQQLDDEYRRSESPFRGVDSPIALFPNPQDIIMGRNKAVATTWSGNVLYRKVIEQHAHRYAEAQVESSLRISKTMIAVEILHLLRDQYKARFLNREDNKWVVIDDSEAQVKISQALRTLAKGQATPR